MFEDSPSYKLEYDGKKEKKTLLKGDGDFRSDECVEILKQIDIVCTNPPFSLIRDFISLLVEHEKDFLIISSMNSIQCKEIFPLIMENKMWTGFKKWGVDMLFIPPKGFVKNKTNHRIIDGVLYARSQACWFTNLSHDKRDEELILGKLYEDDPEAYPKYDNYDAIEVGKVKNIPKDYDGVMGVPISFLEKHNPNQFEILGCTQRGCHGKVPDTRKYNDYWEMRQDGTSTGSPGTKTNENANVEGNNGRNNYFTNGERVIQSKYGRIFIKNKNPEK